MLLRNFMLFINLLIVLTPLDIFSDEIQSDNFEFKNVGKSEQIELLLTSEKLRYLPCEPVVVSITATNVSDSTITTFYPSTLKDKNYEFTVYDLSENQQSHKTNFGNSLFKNELIMFESGSFLDFKPNDSFIKKIQINRIYDMSLSSEYIISVTFHYIDYASRISTYAVSNPIQIQISQENPCTVVDEIGVVPFSIQRESDKYSAKREINGVTEELKMP